MAPGGPREASASQSYGGPRNLAWNAAGLALPLVAAFLAIPMLLQNFGLPRFGAFSLVLALFTYVSVLDLGLSSAITYRVAGMVAAREDRQRVVQLAYGAGAMTLGLGAIVAVAAYQAAPFAALLLQTTPNDLAQETVDGLRLLAVVIPVAFLGSLLAGLLSGYSRFGQVNGVRIVSGVLSTLGVALASFWRNDLVVACVILAAVRVAATVVHLLQARAVLERPSTDSPWLPSRAAMATLFSFGGWLTVSNLVGPFMVYMDRFYLAAVRPVEEVAHYVAPYELATKIALIPGGVLPVVFPVLVARWIHRTASGSQLPAQLAAAMALGCALPAALLAVAGPEIMSAWTGAQVPRSSAAVLQVLAGAAFVNCVAQVFAMQMHSMGRTDVVARLHVGELAVYGVLLWALTGRYGATGVAVAWAARVAVDAVLLCAVATAPMAPTERRACWKIMAATLVFGILLSALAGISSLPWRAAGPLLALVMVMAWHRPLVRFILGRSAAPKTT